MVARRETEEPLLSLTIVGSSSKNIHLGFEALTQAQIIRADLEPPAWLLIKVQASADFDHPAVIEPDFAVVHVGVELYIQLDIELQEALL